MLSAREIADAERQLQSFRLESEKHLKTQGDIVQKYSALLNDYKRLQSDHEEARDSRDKYKRLVRGQDRDPFVLVLIDGDGYLFDETLVCGGAEGGSNAANQLNEAIRAHLRGMDLDHCRIMVRVYANLVGLSKALSHAKLAGPEKRSLAPFVANFNRSGDLYDFVDAGELKENADFKIRANFRQFAESTQCKHIFFAACHDVGYVSELQQYTGNKDRITLIRNYAFHHEFSRLNLREADLPGVFRSTPLVSNGTYTKPSSHFPTPSVDGTKGLTCVFFQKGQCKNGDSCKFKHNSEIASPVKNAGFPKFQMSLLAKNDNDFMTGKPNTNVRDISSPEMLGPVNETINPGALLPREENLVPDKIALNAQQHRLDPYTPPALPEDRAAFEARTTQQKLCNNFHINGFCPNEASCVYDHSPITESMLGCLKYVARHQPCPRRGTCRYANCILGHICQRPDCRHRGGKAFCKIPALSHTVDLHIAGYVQGMGAKTYTTNTTNANHTITPTSNGSAAELPGEHSDSDDDDDDRGNGAAISEASLD